MSAYDWSVAMGSLSVWIALGRRMCMCNRHWNFSLDVIVSMEILSFFLIRRFVVSMCCCCCGCFFSFHCTAPLRHRSHRSHQTESLDIFILCLNDVCSCTVWRNHYRVRSHGIRCMEFSPESTCSEYTKIDHFCENVLGSWLALYC